MSSLLLDEELLRMSLRTPTTRVSDRLPVRKARATTRRTPVFYDVSQRRAYWFTKLHFALLTAAIIAAVCFTTSMLSPPQLPAHTLQRAAELRSALPERGYTDQAPRD